jgi:hypothetical protein
LNFFLKKFEPELPNGVISMPTVKAVGTRCCADGQPVLTETLPVPRRYCADGKVPTATVGTSLCRRQGSRRHLDWFW